MIELTRQEAYAVADFIDDCLFTAIRNDHDIDSMIWLRNVVSAYEKMSKGSGYIGLIEHEEGDTE